MKRFQFEAGALLRKATREYLDQEIFYGANIKYLEQKGFLSSTFLIQGLEADINRITSHFVAWQKQLNQA